MWGAPSTGKTTFLAALATALLEQQEHGWRLRGTDQASTIELGKMRTALVHRGEFPSATQGFAHYHWELVEPQRDAGGVGGGSTTRDNAPQHGFFGWRRRAKTVRIPLDLIDAQGGYANPDVWDSTPRAKDLIDALATSAGIIFLYDPTREFEHGDAFQHTSDLLAQLDLRAGDDLSGWLPQYVAVCLTKFDEVKVLESAEKAGLAEQNPELFDCPYVDEDDAEEFFSRMCRVSRNPAAQTLLPLLRRHFHPDRIKFFVTSAIGFYVDQHIGRYDPDNPQNVIKQPGHPARIRGAIHPVNVVEPVLWLTENLTRTAR